MLAVFFEHITTHNCSSELATFRNSNYSATPIDLLGGGDAPSHLIQPLVKCILDHTTDRLEKRWAVLVVSGVEYGLVLGSVVNMELQTWRLGMRTFYSVWPNTGFAPSLWVVIRIGLHGLSLVLMRLRIRREFGDGDGDEDGEKGVGAWVRGLAGRLPLVNGFRAATRMEWEPCVMQEEVRVEMFGETKTYVCLAWLLHTLTAMHIVYGTWVFSSLSFIGTRDAVCVLGRFMASVLVCRVILMYETVGLREAYLRGNGGTSGTMVTQVPSSKTLPGLWY
ncbi:hypothetical protein B0T16DRAFT_456518 [Cercophora newfieldiana]|uniref:Uncharacterized protein n=1 Tax=Cercophora newfieldiana TaxID=92897 RepID=A0AA40CTU9_9PEZI|nr:hypothetical protein B0T16DRAFT_456518 [Cercophora newfieldiana]